MSLIFRDPFFDGFDEYLRKLPYCSQWLSTEDGEDQLTPLYGYGRMDLHETDKTFELKVDIPGMEKNDISITTENNRLVIEGERKEEKERKTKKCHFSERHFGSFRREVSLPKNVDINGINAVYTNGVLNVTIPKVEVKNDKKVVNIA